MQDFFNAHPVVALGFSGGVDSSYLLHAGLQWGAQIKPYYIKTAFQPAFELRDAYRLSAQVGATLTVLEVDVLTDSQITANTPDRCFYCKAALFGRLCKQAVADGFPLVIDGTNASDDVNDRPGMKALSALSVRSPLRECGLTKAEVRRLSKEAGLFTWDKPAYACLATRVPPHRPITDDLLRRIENAEDAIFALGFNDFRVRVYDEAARLQFPAAQMEHALQERGEIIRAVKPYFAAVLLDLESR